MRYCSKCGAMNDTEARFCQGCGAQFENSKSDAIKQDYTTPKDTQNAVQPEPAVNINPELEQAVNINPEPEQAASTSPEPEQAASTSPEPEQQANNPEPEPAAPNCQAAGQGSASNGAAGQPDSSQRTVYYPPEYAVTTEQKVAKNRAIAGMILGICSLVVPFLNLPAAIVGLVLSAKSLKVQKSGMAKAGKVTSILGIIFSVLSAVLIILLVLWFSSTIATIVDSGMIHSGPSTNYNEIIDFFEAFPDDGSFFYDLY